MKELLFSLLGSFMMVTGFIIMISGVVVSFMPNASTKVTVERFLIVMMCLIFFIYLAYKISYLFKTL